MKVPSVEKIIEQIIELRYKKSYSTMSIIKYLMNEYDLSEGYSYRLLKQARKEVGDLYKKVDENIIQDALESLESMRERANKNGDYKLELDVQKEIDRVKLASNISVESDGDKINININLKDE